MWISVLILECQRKGRRLIIKSGGWVCSISTSGYFAKAYQVKWGCQQGGCARWRTSDADARRSLQTGRVSMVKESKHGKTKQRSKTTENPSQKSYTPVLRKKKKKKKEAMNHSDCLWEGLTGEKRWRLIKVKLEGRLNLEFGDQQALGCRYGCVDLIHPVEMMWGGSRDGLMTASHMDFTWALNVLPPRTVLTVLRWNISTS